MKTPLASLLRKAFHAAQMANQQTGHPADEIYMQWADQAQSRRQFLRHTSRAGALLGVGHLAGPWMPLLSAATRPNIAIVGAGIGGLSAGYYLREKGIPAKIFEADKRVGGRMKSAKIFGGGTLNTEIGAEFIDTDHLDMLHFVKILGLQDQLMDMQDDTFGIKDTFFLDGRHHTVQEVVNELQQVYPRIVADRKKMEGHRGAAWLDSMSMAQYLDGLGISKWLRTLLDAAYLGENGMDASEQSATILVSILEIENQEFRIFGPSDERFKLLGGNDQIPRRIAEKLDGQIQLEHRLLAIKETKGCGIELTFSENGTTRSETFDAAIITVPFTVLRDVEINMSMPDIKRRVIAELGYGANAKFILETKQRSWRNTGYQGYLFNDRVVNGWDSTQLQTNNQGTGTYTVFHGGQRARDAVKGTETEQLSYAMPALEGAFPGIKADFTGKTEIAAWPSNPFIKASYSCFSVGQAVPFEGAASKPVRNLFFAGEHTSVDFWGFMNGGAESGRLAAEKVLKKMRVH